MPRLYLRKRSHRTHGPRGKRSELGPNPICSIFQAVACSGNTCRSYLMQSASGDQRSCLCGSLGGVGTGSRLVGGILPHVGRLEKVATWAFPVTSLNQHWRQADYPQSISFGAWDLSFVCSLSELVLKPFMDIDIVRTAVPANNSSCLVPARSSARTDPAPLSA